MGFSQGTHHDALSTTVNRIRTPVSRINHQGGLGRIHPVLACRPRRQQSVLIRITYVFAIRKVIIKVIYNYFSKSIPTVISKAISIDKVVPLSPDAIDELDSAILDYFLEGRPAEPWGKATPTEVYRALDERGVLSDLGNPVRQTVQNRIQRLALAGHLENKYDSGCYEFVSDPRGTQNER